MDAATRKADELRQQISRAEKELEDLRRQLRDLEAQSGDTCPSTTADATTTTKTTTTSTEPQEPPEAKPWPWPLSSEEYTRYARQLILPGFGPPAQLRLRASSVLIVGAGGLGCPAALYLAGCGIGTLGIVDGDTVEVSNLHRQVGHSSCGVAVKKAESLAARCRDLNPLVRYESHAEEHLSAENAARVLAPYDVVLDCTDRPASRYLVSDACVVLGKPLVSASALRTDGQLIVLNYPPSRKNGRPSGDDGGCDGGGGEGQGDREAGPCYRCVFPRPPPASSVLSCGEGGILGPVVGVMGVLQALEAIKLIIASPPPSSSPSPSPSLLLFSAHSTPPTFRTVRMRGRRPDCFACSPRSTLTLEELSAGSLDYAHFCGVSAPVAVLRSEERVSPSQYNKARRNTAGVAVGTEASPEQEGLEQQEKEKQHLLLDVREKEHYSVASIPGSINVPFSKFQTQYSNYNKLGSPSDSGRRGEEEEPAPQRPDWMPESLAPDAPIYVVCRVGNDSQLVTRKLKEMGLDRDGARFIGDIKGGMRAWKQEVDHTMPFT
jgi:adenylyltransferase and sulfurtransferase